VSDPAIRFPSIDALRAFEAVARLGSHERAAEELNVTASAIGKRLTALEELLGAPLFTRGAKPQALTATGKEYLAQVGAALGLLAAVPLHRRASQRMERVRVTAPPTFARQILVPQLERFTAQHPQIELEIVLSIPYLDAAPTDADVEVRHGDAAAHGGQVLMHERVLPMASPALLARLAPLREPRDLAHVPLLRSPLEPWLPWFRAAGLTWDEPTQGPKLVDLGMTLEAAVSSQGIVLARPSLARHWLATGTLVAPFSLSATPTYAYYLLPHPGSGPAQDFAAWLVGVCADVAAQAQALVSGPG
jgi:LysR family transcriptional regulator, glycine cleavage system transcriptional activator